MFPVRRLGGDCPLWTALLSTPVVNAGSLLIAAPLTELGAALESRNFTTASQIQVSW
jgi:hypothetical protein